MLLPVDAASAHGGGRVDLDGAGRLREPRPCAPWWEDGSALVGLLLAAGGLGRQNQQYLIGKAASPELRRGVSEAITGGERVDSVLELMTMRLSPEQVLVAARVDLADHLSPEELEQAADEIDELIRARFPEVRHLFLGPDPRPP